VELVLDGTSERLTKRLRRWERNAPKREKARLKGSTRWGEETGPYRNQDETIELAVQLNLDPRKPGHAIRGSFPLPHGTGRPVRLAVFCSSDEETRKAVLRAGASLAGGEEMSRKIKAGEIPVDFDRTLATQDVLPGLQRDLARVLGPKGLLPNAKTGNVLPSYAEREEILDAVRYQLRGLVNYRTDKEGIIHAPVGKASFGTEKLLENIRTFMQGIQDAKPELDKKGRNKLGRRKGGGGGKYMLGASLTATQGKGVRVIMKSLDPTSAFFMGVPV